MRDRIDGFYPNIIIAIQDDVIHGIVVAQNERLSQLFVGPNVRGKGVGEKLLGLAEAKLMAEGATRISLTCLKDNLGAKRFYERHNWTAAREIEKPVQTHKGHVPVAVFEMVKSL
jgi:putative acetyltransferase